MYLREIQLDLPYREKPEIIKSIMIQHNCTYEEAVTINYDTNWMIQVRKRFELETRCIAAMFMRLLGKYKTKNCSKIVIDCVEKENRTDYPCYRGSCVGIGLVRYELDYINFFHKNNYEKKQIALQIIKESLYTIGKEEGWDLVPLENVVNKIEELDYNNFWTFGKKTKSPSKLYTAELYIEHNIEVINFFAVIRDKQNDIVKKKLIVTEKPSEWIYNQYLGKLVWISDTKIHLNDKTGVTLLAISL
jgi:hypothetical protein